VAHLDDLIWAKSKQIDHDLPDPPSDIMSDEATAAYTVSDPPQSPAPEQQKQPTVLALPFLALSDFLTDTRVAFDIINEANKLLALHTDADVQLEFSARDLSRLPLDWQQC